MLPTARPGTQNTLDYPHPFEERLSVINTTVKLLRSRLVKVLTVPVLPPTLRNSGYFRAATGRLVWE